MALYVPGTEETDPKKIIQSLHLIAGVNTPGQRQATSTNDDASAGNVGELKESTILVASAVSLTTNIEANVTSLSLTAGDWDTWANISYAPAGTTTSTGCVAWISTTSATVPNAPNSGAFYFSGTNHPAGQAPSSPVGIRRFSLAATTTVYLSCYSTFAVSTMKAYGYLAARRVR